MLEYIHIYSIGKVGSPPLGNVIFWMVLGAVPLHIVWSDPMVPPLVKSWAEMVLAKNRIEEKRKILFVQKIPMKCSKNAQFLC